MTPPDDRGDREVLAGAAQTIGLKLTAAQCDRLLSYREHLVRWNAVFNLSAVRDPGEILRRRLAIVRRGSSRVSRHADPEFDARTTALLRLGPASAATGAIQADSQAGLQSGSVGGSVVVVWNGRPLTPSEQTRLAELSAPLVAFLSSTALTPAERGAASRTRRPQKGPNP